jgi:hypothetical protein
LELNVLALPVLGGFLFVSISHSTKYFLARTPAALVSFWIAVAGLCVLIFARLAVMVCEAAISLPPGRVALLILTVGLAPFLALFASAVALYHYARQRPNERPIWYLYAALLSVGYSMVSVRAIWGAAKPLFGSGLWTITFWVVGFAGLLSVCAWLSRLSNLPGPKVMLRLSLVGLAAILIAAYITVDPSATKKVWLSLSAPAGKQIESEALGISFLTCLFGPLAALMLNIFYPNDAVIASLFRRRVTNSLDCLFYGAIQRAKMIMLTLDDGKVYCGYAERIPGNPSAPDAYLEILPIFSGYRDKDTHRVYLPVSYIQLYQRLNLKDLSQFKKVMPIARITSAGEYEPRYFQTFGELAAGPRTETEDELRGG